MAISATRRAGRVVRGDMKILEKNHADTHQLGPVLQRPTCREPVERTGEAKSPGCHAGEAEIKPDYRKSFRRFDPWCGRHLNRRSEIASEHRATRISSAISWNFSPDFCVAAVAHQYQG
jgi:hypothetical protein